MKKFLAASVLVLSMNVPMANALPAETITLCGKSVPLSLVFDASTYDVSDVLRSFKANGSAKTLICAAGFDASIGADSVAVVGLNASGKVISAGRYESLTSGK